MVDNLSSFDHLKLHIIICKTITQKKVNTWNAIIKIASGNCGKIAP